MTKNDLAMMKSNLAKLQDQTEWHAAQQRGSGDQERVSLYYLNLAALMGERYVGPLIAEVEALRAAVRAQDEARQAVAS